METQTGLQQFLVTDFSADAANYYLLLLGLVEQLHVQFAGYGARAIEPEDLRQPSTWGSLTCHRRAPVKIPSATEVSDVYQRFDFTVREGLEWSHVEFTACAFRSNAQRYVDATVTAWMLYFSWTASEPGLPDRVIESALAYFRASGLALEAVDGNTCVEEEIADAALAAGEELDYLAAAIQSLQDGPLAASLREERERHRKTERRLEKHLDQLKTELDIARATSDRLRQRADRAERVSQLPAPSGARLDPQAPPASEAERVASLEQRAAQLDQERRQIAEDRDRMRSEVFRLTGLLASATSPGPEPDPSPLPVPSDLHAMATWAMQALHGRVVIHPKAARAARKSNFANPALLYAVLQALASDYWQMRFATSPTEAKSRWDRFLASHYLTCGPTGAAIEDRRTADAYRVTWQGKSVALDMHVQGHSGRDETRSLRVYFHVDVQHQVIVVGHAPSHLPNTLT